MIAPLWPGKASKQTKNPETEHLVLGHYPAQSWLKVWSRALQLSGSRLRQLQAEELDYITLRSLQLKLFLILWDQIFSDPWSKGQNTGQPLVGLHWTGWPPTPLVICWPSNNESITEPPKWVNLDAQQVLWKATDFGKLAGWARRYLGDAKSGGRKDCKSLSALDSLSFPSHPSWLPTRGAIFRLSRGIWRMFICIYYLPPQSFFLLLTWISNTPSYNQDSG